MSQQINFPDVDLHKQILGLGVDSNYACDAANTVFFKNITLEDKKALCGFLRTELDNVIAEAQYVKDRIPVF